MSKLDEQELKSVSKWIEEGAGLGEVQRRIQEEFGISMTYMEVRFLALDIGAAVKDKAKPQEPKPAEAPPAKETPAAEAGVSVSVDKVVRAGALYSGSVTFSDGVTASWLVDGMGRLSLTKVSKPGYEPGEGDIEAFQMKLQEKLASGGR